MPIKFNCDYCGKESSQSPSHYNKKEKHFCNTECYSEYRKTLPKEKQHRFGTGHGDKEKQKRALCRGKTLYAIKVKKLIKEPCEICGNSLSQAHHDNYDEPLNVKWMCFTHHRQYHIENYKILKEKYDNNSIDFINSLPN